MINFARQLIAAPIRLLLLICRFLPIFNKLVLVEILWFLSQQAEDGSALVALTASAKGIQAADEKAEKILQQTGDARIAETIAWLQVNINRDLNAASQWIQRASREGFKNTEMLGRVELFLSRYVDEYDTQEVVERILSRNDLPMQFTRDALLWKGQLLLEQTRWEQAKEIAARMLSIEENKFARKLLAFAEQNRNDLIFQEND